MSVSVIIAAYNAEKTIVRAVQSALAEPEVVEVIVVDDASTDQTVLRAEAANDGSGRLKVISFGKNSGPSVARNKAIAECTGDWIAILDSDDYFARGRFERLQKYDADMIADNLLRMHEDDVDYDRLPNNFQQMVITLEQFLLSNVTNRRNSGRELGFLKPVMRREFIQENNLRYRDHMRLGEDYDFYARMLATGAKMLLVSEAGYFSIIREGSLSNNHSELDLLNLRDCNILLEKEFTLSKRERRALRKNYLSTDCRLQWRLLIVAVKQRNIRAAIQTFMHPFPVPLYLIARLQKQLFMRSAKKLKLRTVKAEYFPGQDVESYK